MTSDTPPQAAGPHANVGGAASRPQLRRSASGESAGSGTDGGGQPPTHSLTAEEQAFVDEWRPAASFGGFASKFLAIIDRLLAADAPRTTAATPPATTEAVRRELDHIREFALAHHGDQPAHRLLHSLTVDIPAICDAAIDRLSGGGGAADAASDDSSDELCKRIRAYMRHDHGRPRADDLLGECLLWLEGRTPRRERRQPPPGHPLTAEQLERFQKMLSRWADEETEDDEFSKGRKFGLMTAAAQVAIIREHGFDFLAGSADSQRQPPAQGGGQAAGQANGTGAGESTNSAPRDAAGEPDAPAPSSLRGWQAGRGQGGGE